MAGDEIQPAAADGERGSRSASESSPSADNVEAHLSFGEPLHVSISRATTRFQTIQRAYSQPVSEAEMEEGVGHPGVVSWLLRRSHEGAPFAKRFGVVFRDLDVFGADVSNHHIATLISPFWKALKGVTNGFGILQLLHSTKRQLIHGFTGEVREGEMLLVLGRPGSGCSTLLRVLGNHRKTYSKISGTVSYGGLSPTEVQRHFRGEVAYNQEED
ncbi:ATP-binding cassette transporter snq2, partial [Coemansia nantahalensis]